MDSFGLQCFVEVVRTGGFSKAASSLYRTQPAISQQIKGLEKELGLSLIDRSKKKIALTQSGQLLYKNAVQLLESMDNIKNVLTRGAQEPSGTLTIATNLSLINNYLPRIIGSYQVKYPQVKIVFLSRRSEGIAHAILEGNANIGIGYLLHKNMRIASKTIFKSPFMYVACKDQFPGTADLTSSDLRKHPFIHFESKTDMRSYIEHTKKLTWLPKKGIELPSIESILHYVKHGLGFSIIPEFALSEYWRKELTIRPMPPFMQPLNINLYTHPKRPLPPAAQAFIKLLF